jgi:hypothetical protein
LRSQFLTHPFSLCTDIALQNWFCEHVTIYDSFYRTLIFFQYQNVIRTEERDEAEDLKSM